MSGKNSPEDPDAFGSTPSHSPSWSLIRKPTPEWSETQYGLEIQVVSTEDGQTDTTTTPAWQLLIVEDMV